MTKSIKKTKTTDTRFIDKWNQPESERNTIKGKQAHTPGPWTITCEHGRIMSKKGPVMICGPDRVICGEGNPEHLANAHLIASAPSMKALLDDIINAMPDNDGNVTLTRENIKEIKALLAKAEGKV